jgi:hypothetical protein
MPDPEDAHGFTPHIVNDEIGLAAYHQLARIAHTCTRTNIGQGFQLFRSRVNGIKQREGGLRIPVRQIGQDRVKIF